MKRPDPCALFATSCIIVTLGFLGSARQTANALPSPPVVADGLSGTVTGPKGPEAGVWVIAETMELPTHFVKIVVTDDQGRFVVPELPKASYQVWVRGYGLVDSVAVPAKPGARLKLTALPAPNAAAAAQYYPANYWWALLHPPATSEFPGTGPGPQGNGIDPNMKSQQEWLANLKYCTSCHEFGDKWMRAGASTAQMWNQRVQFARGPTDPVMGNKGDGYAFFMKFLVDRFGRESLLKMLGDWSGRIAQGALPTAVPSRPTGVERNLVITEWAVGGGTFIHDEVASDRRDPGVNAHGPIYGVESHVGKLVIFNPTTMASEDVVLPDGDNSFPHSVTMDGQGRAWVVDNGTRMQLTLKPPARPDYCSNGSINKYASYFPQPGTDARFFVYDPGSKTVTKIPACFYSQHQWFDSNSTNTLYFAGDSVIGWIDTTLWDQTHDAQKATGWCPMVIDTKARQDGTQADPDVTILPDRAQWNELGKTADPAKDTRIPYETYGLSVNPRDGSVWLGIWNYPGGIVRFVRGSHAPDTCKSEYYVPPKLPDGNYAAFMPHDVGIDSKGIAWVTFTSGQIGRFDRRQCKVLRGPSATGAHCPEGWTIYDDPSSPKIADTSLNSDFYYQMYVDQHGVFGLGKDVPLVPATNSDAMVALMPGSGKYVTFRVPYPMGYFGRWTDARIDDPKADWKGRGVWSVYSTVPVWHQEPGPNGMSAELTKFQLRPNPLAH